MALQAFDELGVSSDKLLARAGLSRSRLMAGERLAIEAELRIWDAAQQLSGDEAIGLRLAELVKPGALGSLEYLLRNSDTPRTLLERAARFAKLVDDLVTITWSCTAGVVTICVGREGGYPMHRACIECILAVAVAMAQGAWPDEGPIAVHFKHRRPADMSPYIARFGANVTFGARSNAVQCPESALHVRALHADSKLGQILEQHAAHLLAQRSQVSSFVDAAAERIRSLLPSKEAGSSGLARALRVSERTMRRRLALEGTSFFAVQDDARRRLVLSHMVHGTRSIEQIAELAGFRDLSGFYRAFRRWTGTTPAKYNK